MKNKKTLVIIIIIALLLIIAGIIGFVCYQNMNQDDDYDKVAKKYEKLAMIATQMNALIDKELVESQALIATNPDVGSDKASLENLQNTVKELESLKIEIPEKSKKSSELNSSIEKMEEAIKQIDENLLDSEEFKNADEITEDFELTLSENSKANTLISNIGVLTEEVNEDVEKEADRKAAEEKKAKEEAEKKAKEEALAKVAKGDFSYFAGTYVDIYNHSSKLTLDKNGKVTIDGRVFTNKPISITKRSNGSYWCLVKAGELADDGFIIYPAGVGSGNTSKVRIDVLEALGALTYQKQ